MNKFVIDNESNNLGDVFDKHLEFEFYKEDVDAPTRRYIEINGFYVISSYIQKYYSEKYVKKYYNV